MKSAKMSTKKYIWLLLLIVAVAMLTAVFFCAQKKGFHEDEFYTFYSTARTNGFFVEDGQWMDHDTYYQEYIVLPEQGFQYGLVKLVQSWDVHPPVYYWIFHTVDSLCAGSFSKWIGLSVNLVFYCFNLLLMAYLSYLVSGKNAKMSLLATWFYALTPAVVSGVIFIRMYEVLCFFVFLCAVLHTREILRLEKQAGETTEETVKGNRKLSFVKFLMPITVVTYLGFLTQYYYFIFLFFLAVAFCLYLLWKDRNLWNCIRYGISQTIAFVSAYLTYPAWPGQMFHGQRGAQATGNFFDLSNTFDRLAFYYDLLDEYVFGGLLTIALLIAILLFLFANYRRTKKQTAVEKTGNAVLLFVFSFTVLGYFFAVSKTALLLGETSIRYQLPIYGIVILLVFMAFSAVLKEFVPEKCWKYAGVVCAVICLAVNLFGLCTDKVVFLYPEAEEQMDYARQQSATDTPVVYLYNTGDEWCIWGVADELFAYSRVYFASTAGAEKITDSVIQNADRLVVYVADGADESQLQRILNSNENLKEYTLKFEEKFCNVYEFR